LRRNRKRPGCRLNNSIKADDLTRSQALSW
jgi:hypothetical protein